MSAHTPGPWIGAGPSFGDLLPRYRTEIVTEWEDEDGEVCSICELPFAHHDDENEANARLIAAAPDLLAALRVLLRDVEAVDAVADYGLELQSGMYQAHKAIVKATGGAA